MAEKGKKQDQIDTIRKKTGLKNMYFNRYLMIRYFLAIFIFTNIYWLFCVLGTIAMIFPATLLIASIPTCVETIKTYGNPKYHIRWTERFLKLQLIMNIMIMIFIWTPMFTLLFPFLIDVANAKLVVGIISLLGTFMTLACLYRLKQIVTNSDKHYTRIKEYEKKAQIHL